MSFAEDDLARIRAAEEIEIETQAAGRTGPPDDHLGGRRRRRRRSSAPSWEPAAGGSARRPRTPRSRSTSTAGGSPATAIPATDPDSIDRINAALTAKYTGIEGYDSMFEPDNLDDEPPPRARLTRARHDSPRGSHVLRRIQAPASRTSTRPRPRTGSTRSTSSSSQEGESRARFLVYKLLKRARQLHVGLPPLTQTRYINTISPEQEPFFPGDEQIELRIRRIIRWNAVAMVLRANNRFTGIGGHLATYA